MQISKQEIDTETEIQINQLLYQLLSDLKNPQEAKKLLSQAYKAIDKAMKTHVIKPNTAARKKSKIAKLIGR